MNQKEEVMNRNKRMGEEQVCIQRGSIMKTFSIIVITLALAIAAVMPFMRPAASHADEGGMAEWLEMVAGGAVGHMTGPAGEIGFHFLLHPCETYWGAIAAAVRAEEIRALTIMASDPNGNSQAGRDAAAKQDLLRTLSEQWMAACGGSEAARTAIRDAIVRFKQYAGMIASDPAPTATPAPTPGPDDAGGGTTGDSSGGSSGGSTGGADTSTPPESGGSTGGSSGAGSSEDPCDPCQELREKLAKAEADLAANLAQQAALQAQIAALQAQIAGMQADLQEMQNSILTGYRSRSDPDHGLLTDAPGGVDATQWEQMWQSQSDLDEIAALQAQIAAAQAQLAGLQAQLAALQAAEAALRQLIDDLKQQLKDCEEKHKNGTLEPDPCPPQHDGGFFDPLSDPFESLARALEDLFDGFSGFLRRAIGMGRSSPEDDCGGGGCHGTPPEGDSCAPYDDCGPAPVEDDPCDGSPCGDNDDCSAAACGDSPRDGQPAAEERADASLEPAPAPLPTSPALPLDTNSAPTPTPETTPEPTPEPVPAPAPQPSPGPQAPAAGCVYLGSGGSFGTTEEANAYAAANSGDGGEYNGVRGEIVATYRVVTLSPVGEHTNFTVFVDLWWCPKS
jgi:prefoldin subunit 5